MHQFLKDFNFSSYGAYLESDLWASIRSRVMERDQWTCRACRSAGGSCVHHRSYKRRVLEGVDDRMLVTLCRDCHRYIEFFDDGSKIPFCAKDEKEARLSKLVERNLGISLTAFTEAISRSSHVNGRLTRIKMASDKREQPKEESLGSLVKALKASRKENDALRAELSKLRKRISKDTLVKRRLPMISSSPLASRVKRLACCE